MRHFSFVVEFDLHDGYCRKREGFQLLSVCVTDKQGDGTMGPTAACSADCLVVKRTAGASDDKRGVSIILRKGHFRNWFKEREGRVAEDTVRVIIKQWERAVNFAKMGPSKGLILFNF